MNRKALLMIPLLLISIFFFFIPSVSAIDKTFTGETIDGHIYYWKATNPPDPTGEYNIITGWTYNLVGQQYFESTTYIASRMYISFDTSALPDDALINNVTLQLKTEMDNSTKDFLVGIASPEFQPYFESELNIDVWEMGYYICDSWNTSDYVDETYVNFTLPIEYAQVNKTGRTQFQILSDRELWEVEPTVDEYVSFHSGDSTGNEPKLIVSYTVETPTGEMKQIVGDNWFFANEYHDFEATYTYGGTFDTVKLAFSDLYDANSLLFDNTDDSVDFLGDALEPPNLDYLTISIWFQTSANTTGIIDPILATYAWDKGGYVIEIQNNKIGFAVYGGAIAYTYNTVNDGEWHYLVGTMDYTTWTYSCYLDGVFQTSHAVPVPQRAKVAITGFRLGNAFGGGNYFDGSLDQLSVFNRILSQTEMDYNQLHYKVKSQSDLIGSWNMDEGTGTVLYDNSFNGYSGTINDATWQDGNILIDEHWVIASYDVIEDIWSLDSGSEIVNIKTGSTEQIGEDFIVTYSIYFNNKILDKINVDIYLYSTNTTGTKFYWEEVATDYFNIYNLGGQTTLETSGTSGRTIGGDYFHLYAESAGGFAQTNITWNKLQHWRMSFAVNFNESATVNNPAKDKNYIEFGMYYEVNDVWVKGWKVRLNVTAWDNGGTASWNEIYCTWYRGESNIWVITHQSYVYTFYEGHASRTENVLRFWLDLWFNQENASSIAGGRITTYYYPMNKEGFPGLASWGRWQGPPTDASHEVRHSSDYFMPLLDNNGKVTSSPQITMMKAFTKVYCNTAGYNITLKEIGSLDYRRASGEMEGVATPEFIDPVMIEEAGGGWWGGLIYYISTLQKEMAYTLSLGMFNLWDLFVASLDGIAVQFGFAGGFSDIINAIGDFFSWFATSLSYLVTMFTDMFSFLSVTMTRFLSSLGNVITGWINIANALFEIIDNGLNQGINIFDVLINSLILPLISVISILYFVWRFDKGGIDAITNDIKFILDVLGFLIHTLLGVAQFFLALVGRLIESIPGIQ